MKCYTLIRPSITNCFEEILGKTQSKREKPENFMREKCEEQEGIAVREIEGKIQSSHVCNFDKSERKLLHVCLLLFNVFSSAFGFSILEFLSSLFISHPLTLIIVNIRMYLLSQIDSFQAYLLRPFDGSFSKSIKAEELNSKWILNKHWWKNLLDLPWT